MKAFSSVRSRRAETPTSWRLPLVLLFAAIVAMLAAGMATLLGG
ncbi:hypothetical protein [Saccharomonospora viridis]|nr:hypothetical protein [Saccharomonospora viridis]